MSVCLLISLIGPFIRGVTPLFDAGEIMAFDAGYLMSAITSFVIGLLLFVKPNVRGSKISLDEKGQAKCHSCGAVACLVFMFLPMAAGGTHDVCFNVLKNS